MCNRLHHTFLCPIFVSHFLSCLPVVCTYSYISNTSVILYTCQFLIFIRMNVLTGDKEYFKGIGQVQFEGLETDNPLAFRWYD